MCFANRMGSLMHAHISGIFSIVQLKRLVTGLDPGHFARHLQSVVDNYNKTRHRTIKMTPEDALGAIDPPSGAPAEEFVKVARLRETIKQNTAAAGMDNLNRVRKERAKLLPPLAAGDLVLVSAGPAKKKHSSSVGQYVNELADATLLWVHVFSEKIHNASSHAGGLRLRES
jgi:hypothetical protein